MGKSWTFGQKVGAGFFVIVALAMVIGGVAIYGLRAVVESKDQVILRNGENLIDAVKLDLAIETKSAAMRGYRLTGEERSLEEAREARGRFRSTLRRLESRADEEGKRMLARIEQGENEHEEATDQELALRRAEGETKDAAARYFDDRVLPKREHLGREVDAFVQREQRLREEGKTASTTTAVSAINVVVAISVACAAIALALAFVLTSALGRQIGSAVGHVESSSAELQAAANQQATGAKEQATAMSEITTTISELLATSRQIAESAQRVAAIAGDTVASARSGDQIVQRAQESVGQIRRQVDLIVGHMLELGKKSQQIGSILEIINELSEQTNILSINATIEAVGAGEAGKRFAVVADEIRKLADRVGGSTKEIRSLIEEIRAAVNTTVMATESGSKSVDAGTREFGDVAASFRHIAGLVGTTTEAAREIELSTKQQTTAVEQVNVAVSNVAQATRETEASAGQTVQTATQLNKLSRELSQLIRSEG